MEFCSIPERRGASLPCLDASHRSSAAKSFLRHPVNSRHLRCNGRDLRRSHLSNNMSGMQIESDFWVFRYVGKSSKRWQRADVGLRLFKVACWAGSAIVSYKDKSISPQVRINSLDQETTAENTIYYTSCPWPSS